MRETIDESPVLEDQPNIETDAFMDNIESTLALIPPILTQYNGQMLQVLSRSNHQLFEDKKALGSMDAIERRLLARYNEEIYEIIAESTRQLFDTLDSLKGFSHSARTRRKGAGASIETLGSQLVIQQLVDHVCEHFRVSSSDIMSRTREPDIVLPRHVCMYLMQQELKMSSPKIARVLNRKDHTTILHGIKKIKHQQEINPELRESIEAIQANLCLPQ